MILRDALLTAHILSVVVWLGAGLYGLFVAHEIKRHRGQPAEVEVMPMPGMKARVTASLGATGF